MFNCLAIDIGAGSGSVGQKGLDEEEQKTKLTKEARPQVPEKTLSTETANPPLFFLHLTKRKNTMKSYHE